MFLLWLSSLTDHMFGVFFVLVADILADIASPASSSDALMIFQGFAYVPGSSIVNSISRCPRSGSAESARLRASFRCADDRACRAVERSSKPTLPTTSVSCSQCPMECPIHIGFGSLGCGAAIQKYLPVAGDVVFEKHHQQPRRLNQLEREQSTGRNRTPRQAMRSRRVFGVIRRTLAEQRFGPRQRLRFPGIHGPLRIPNAGEIRLAVPGSRRWPGGRRRMRAGELKTLNSRPSPRVPNW